MFMQWLQIAPSVRRLVALLREDKDMLIIMMMARRVNSLRRLKSIGKTEILARRFEIAMLQRRRQRLASKHAEPAADRRWHRQLDRSDSP